MTDSTKDEAARCVRIAEAAIASGDRERALKFIKIARRLDQSIPVDVLLDACKKLDGAGTKISTQEMLGTHSPKGPSSSKASAPAADCDQGFTEEHARLIREISRSKDYYVVLGVERGCSGEEIRRAYRKLCLKVHPDKNKAPGAEEAFKAICKAFKCLSDEGSRKVYDQGGSTSDFEVNQHYHHGGTRRRRTRATRDDFFDEGFDADEMFRSFFGYEGDVLRAHRAHRARAAAHQRRNSNADAEGLGFLSLIQILPIFIIFMLVFLPYSEPEYFLRQSHTYHIPKITEKHGVEYYVRSEDFDQKYPQGSPSREKLEDDIFRDYMSVLRRYCNIELQRRQRLTNYPTPFCDKLRDFMAA